MRRRVAVGYRLLLVLGGSLGLLGILGLAIAGSSSAARIPEAEAAVTTVLSSSALANPDVVDAPFSFHAISPAPAVDGHLAPGEYAQANTVTFDGYAGDVEAFLQHDGNVLYVAFESPDTTPYPYNSGGGTGPAFQVFLDTDNDKAPTPQTDDYRLTVTKGGSRTESRGNGTSWGGGSGAGWSAAVYTTTWGWQAEFAIQFSKLGITSSTTATVGLALAEVWTPSWPHDWYWPEGGDWDQPTTWGFLVSSSAWGTFRWKSGPWEDYAPSGLPDFDQKQDGWSGMGTTGPVSTHCGPVALANSLWWFDSREETADHGPATHISDTYRLITSSQAGGWDDHDPKNVVPLVDSLAWYVDTNGLRTGDLHNGTVITDLHAGLRTYLHDRGLWDDYLVSLVARPGYDWVAHEVMRSEDVVLLLGFWELVFDPDGIPCSGDEIWQRVGGALRHRGRRRSNEEAYRVQRSLCRWGGIRRGRPGVKRYVDPSSAHSRPSLPDAQRRG